jgi:hypothetical protein
MKSSILLQAFFAASAVVNAHRLPGPAPDPNATGRVRTGGTQKFIVEVEPVFHSILLVKLKLTLPVSRPLHIDAPVSIESWPRKACFQGVRV